MSVGARERFDELVAYATSLLTGDEVALCTFSGEDSDFVRFNGDAVRQAGSVRQRTLDIDLVDGRRHATGSISVTEQPDTDRHRVRALLEDLREHVRVVPEDPYLLFSTDAPSTVVEREAALPDASGAIDRVLDASRGRDLAGVYAAGNLLHGFASSTGVRHWFRSGTFNLDWSYYLHDDKATKNGYAGTVWRDDEFESKVAWSARQLDALHRDPIDLPPGEYRTFLAPAAMQEIVDMLAWGGFGLKAHRTMQTPLLRMITDDATLHPSIRIREDIAGGTAPAFQSQGFAKPDEIVLVDGGRYAGHLVSPRSAQEYGVATNGAEEGEYPVAVAFDPGTLPTDGVLDALDDGLYVGNLWYLNFSDRAACRTTGMTRFGTFWVDKGEIVAPVNVLRFDDTAFHLLGDRLEGLTDTTEVILDPSSYGARSTASSRLPGALVSAMTFTL